MFSTMAFNKSQCPAQKHAARCHTTISIYYLQSRNGRYSFSDFSDILWDAEFQRCYAGDNVLTHCKWNIFVVVTEVTPDIRRCNTTLMFPANENLVFQVVDNVLVQCPVHVSNVVVVERKW